VRLVLIALLLAACATEQHVAASRLVLDAQDRAVAFAWVAVGGRGDSPPVLWINGVHCKGREWLAIEFGDICVDGIWDGHEATVMVPPGPRASLADSSLTHELQHAAFQFNDGDPDGEHDRDEWSAVPLAEAAMREAGL
jgi:hypothetical protein